MTSVSRAQFTTHLAAVVRARLNVLGLDPNSEESIADKVKNEFSTKLLLKLAQILEENDRGEGFAHHSDPNQSARLRAMAELFRDPDRGYDFKLCNQWDYKNSYEPGLAELKPWEQDEILSKLPEEPQESPGESSSVVKGVFA